MVLDAYNVGLYEVPNDISLQEIYDLWFKGKSRKVKTMHMYEYAWGHLSSLKDSPIAEIKAVHLQRVIDKASDAGLAYNTISSIKTLAGQLYKYALKNDIVKKDYSEYIEMPKADKTSKEIFTDLEIKKLHELADTDPYITPILIMIYTGLRITELMELTRFNVDLENMVITGGIKTEAGRDRVIPIHPKIQEYIRYWYNLNGERLILSSTGKPMTSHNYRNRYVHRLLSEHGFRDNLTPHSCRHTFASKLAVAGVDTLHIQKLIGHADYAMTANVYSHLDVEELKESIFKMK